MIGRWLLIAVGRFCQSPFGQELISVLTGDGLEQGTLSVDAELLSAPFATCHLLPLGSLLPF